MTLSYGGQGSATGCSPGEVVGDYGSPNVAYGGDGSFAGTGPMGLPLSDLRRLVRQRVGVPTTDDFFTDSVLNDVINDAIGSIEEERCWPWSEGLWTQMLFAGTNIVELPCDWRATRGLFIGGDELILVAASDLLTWSGSGRPGVYADVGRQIRVAPVPSSDVEVIHYYQVMAPYLVLDTDRPFIPASMTGAIVAKAAELLSAREDDQAARAAHLADYKAWTDRIRDSVRRTRGPLKVRVRPGGWI